MGKTCPVCGHANAATAERCECGWDFATERREGLTLAEIGGRSIKLGRRLILAGTLGGLFLLAAYAILKPANTGFILFPLYGAVAHIAGGVLLVIRGARQRSRPDARSS